MKPHILAAVLGLLGLTACTQLQPELPPDHAVDFVAEVKPLLESRCLECHHRRYVCAGLNLETKALAMKGGRSGPVIIPGAPHQSLLYKVLLLGHENPVAMPPTPEGVEREQQKLLHDWILQGAPWPEKVRLVPPQDWKTNRS
ncbi:c-type cytochrome domain-containing protein [Prosthecobacter sp.]|uniref:c-type cytochrome domain-containing protein n=1 Tax=Prosthecobacter sp. TaxID=1965333 RepID=UPI003782FCF2